MKRLIRVIWFQVCIMYCNENMYSENSIKRILNELTVTFEKSFWHETKWTFRAKSMCTSFHQNELHLQAMIESLRRSLRDRLLCSSSVPTSLYNHPFFSRTFHPRIETRPTRFHGVDRWNIVIDNDIIINCSYY